MAEETMLRDELAIDRTKLANERTLLAYVRTAFALIVLAAFVIKFIPSTTGVALAFSSAILAGGVFFFGIRNYRAVSMRISGMYQPSRGTTSLENE